MQAKTVIALILGCAAVCPVAALAGPRSASTDLGVARVSVVKGDVATRRGDSGDWIATMVNSPIVEGDSVRTVEASRAEVQLSPGNFVRIVGDSEAQFVELGEKVFRVRVIHGTVLYSELPDSPADIDIETPFAAVRPQQRGRYRIHVGADSTVIEVREGKTEIALENSTSSVSAGKAITLWQGSSGVEFEMGRASNRDGFDRWAWNRDRELRRSSAYRYVSRDIYGIDTFDDHGSWRLVPSVGYCWFPRVPVTWVPYRHGHWTWIDYYGWNWVAYAPWGWATSHWGRWHHHPIHGWGWYPGTPRLRHIWKPALVSFIGAAIHSAFDRIAWVPLAPGEVYRPWYGRSIYGFGRGRSAIGNTIIVDNSVNITNNYRYARGGSGVSAVSYLGADQFGAAGANTPRGMRFSQSARGVAIRGPLPVVPNRASQGRVLSASSSNVRVASPTSWNRASVSQLRDGTQRVPFDDQRASLRSSVDDFHRRYGSRAASAASNASTRAGGVQASSGRQVRANSAAALGREPAANPSSSPLQAQRRSVEAASVSGSAADTRKANASAAATDSGRQIRRTTAGAARTQPAISSVRGGQDTQSEVSTRVAPARSNSRLGSAVTTAGTSRVSTRRLPSSPRGASQTRVPASAPRSSSSVTVPAASQTTRGTVFAPRSRSRVGAGANSGTQVRMSQQRVGTRSSGGIAASRATGSSSVRTAPPGSGSTSGARSRVSAPPATSTSRSSRIGTTASSNQRRGSTTGATIRNQGVRQGSRSSASPTFRPRTQSRITSQPSSSRGGFGTSPSQRSAPSYRRPTVGATSSSRSSQTGTGTSSSTRRGTSSRAGSGSTARTPSRVSSRSSSSGGLFGNRSTRSSGRGPSSPGVSATRSQRSTPSYRRPTVGATSSSRGSRIGPGSSSSSVARQTYGGSRSSSSGNSRLSSTQSSRPSSSSTTRRSSSGPADR